LLALSLRVPGLARSPGRLWGLSITAGIVWDEIVAIWLVLFVASNHFSSPIEQLTCVLLFRFFDMVKPPRSAGSTGTGKMVLV
jgi:hypothetical protein